MKGTMNQDVMIKDDDLAKQKPIQIAEEISKGDYDIAQFVERLGSALTSTVVENRVKGTKLLSDVLAELPKDYLNPKQLEFLSTFYADRLKDHHNVLPAIIDGIGVLMRMKQLPPACISQLLNCFFAQTTCQSQVREDRGKFFRILHFVSEHYAAELKAMGADFIYGVINSIDGERDPRNLIYIFTFMPKFIAEFPLFHLSEEMFEIFACYFPIDFNPYTNDPESITRDQLADKLANCLVAHPTFAEWTITLALEKLESDLIAAKLDSLELLKLSALKFSPKTIEPHFQNIWNPLKIEIFPGKDNVDVVSAGLNALRTILEQASIEPDISHNYQTIVLGVILTHLSDVNQRLFDPATAIALVCIAGDSKFASEKILNTFLLKLKTTEPPSAVCNDEQRTKFYTIVAQIYKIASLRNTLEQIQSDVTTQIHEDVIATLRANTEGCDDEEKQNHDLMRAALSVLNESVPIVNEANRALIYKVLTYLITHQSIDLEFTQLLEQLGALYPIELQSNCLNIFIDKFIALSSFAKRKLLKNLLPLTNQMAFTQRVLDLITKNIFNLAGNNENRLIALEALNSLLKSEDQRFIVDLQMNSNLIEQLVKLAQSSLNLDLAILEQISEALSLIVQQLSITEQYMIATEYLPNLNLQQEADLFVAKGLLGFLHKDLSLDDHFERLLEDLTKLSLESENEELRKVSNHLLASLVNKIAYNDANKGTIAKIVEKLRGEIRKENKKAVEVLSWIGKGLIVRGADEAGDIIEALAELLDHPSLSSAATLAFEIISAEYPQLHLPVIKFLFKQKFFHTIIAKLGEKLKNYCEHHVNAFIFILKTTPHSVLKMNIETIGPIIFKSLEKENVHTLVTSLHICENFIKQKDDYFSRHLQHLIPRCIELSKFKNSMQVRISALNLLYDITQYPIYLLLPYKTDTVLELAPALDDPKRLVRNAAVQARNEWFLIGAPNNSSGSGEENKTTQ